VVVKLKAIVAIDVAAIFGVKVAEDRPERVWMDSGSEVGDYPAAQSPKAVKALVVQAREHNLPPRSPPPKQRGGDLQRWIPGAGKYSRFLLTISFSADALISGAFA